MKPLSLLLILVFVFSCQSSRVTSRSSKDLPERKKTVSLDREADLKDQNSYYYFLVSQMKSLQGVTDEAQHFLKQALQKDPDSSLLLSQKASYQASLKDLPEALQNVKKAIKKDPNNIEALLLLGKIYSAQNQNEKSIQQYRQVLGLAPQNEEAYNLLARDYLILRDQNSAIQTLAQCVENLPESVPCLYYLATIYLENKNYDKAISYYTMITDLDPEQLQILETIAEIYVQKNDAKKALKIYEQIAEKNPENISVQIRAALLYYQLEKIDLAIEKFLKLQKKFSGSDRINYFLGMLFLDKKDFEKAFSFFDLVDSGSTFFRDALNRQMLILRQSQRFEEAVALLERRFPSKDMAEYYHLKGTLLLLQGDYRTALTILNQGLRYFPEEESLYFQRAVAYEKSKEWEKAKNDLLKIIEKNPNSAEAYNFLGYTMAEKDENLPQALVYVKKAIELKPREGHILDSLGWVYFKMGDVSQALSIISSAHQLQPDEPTIAEHLGDIYFTLKDKRKARYYFNKSLKILRDLPFKRQEDLEQIQKIEEKLAQF